MELQAAYDLIASVAKPTESEGLKKERSILLLWYVRNALGIDDLEAYEYICDGDHDKGVDGMVLNEAREGEALDTLTILQSKYPLSAKNAGESDVRDLIGMLAPFESVEGLETLLKGKVEPELRELIERFDVLERLRSKSVRIEATLIVAGKLTPEARELIKAENLKQGREVIRGVDLFDLAPLVVAFTSPVTVTATVRVAAAAGERFVSAIANGRVVVCSVPVSDVVAWPGIADRRLFDLNVRRELSTGGRVRAALDNAIAKSADHKNFLAFHNGLTVVCEKMDDSNAAFLEVTNLSVVNGAQSTIAFFDNKESVTKDLRIVVKFVEVPAASQLAREVAIRSNTQNPVNARNLRARDGIQLRLRSEISSGFPGVTYELMPDASNPPKGHVIQNDEAAQLLCAVVEQRPWLAVKKLLLFEADVYPTIFRRDTTGSQVVLVDRIAARVQVLKNRFPKEYLGSWKLTRLVAAYLVGQLLRADKEGEKVLEAPADALKSTAVDDLIDKRVKFAAAAMITRRDGLLSANQADDFKVAFKRDAALRDLAQTARNSFLTYKAVDM